LNELRSILNAAERNQHNKKGGEKNNS